MDSFRVSDRAAGIVLGALTVGYLVVAWRIPTFSLGTVPIQSRTFPLGLGLALLVMSAVLILRPRPSTRTGKAADDERASVDARDGEHPLVGERPIPRRSDDPRVEVGVVLAGAAAYIALFVPLGFIVATVLYIVAMAWWYRQERLWVAVVVATVLAVGGQLAFTELLRVRLPGGLLAPFGF